MPIEYQPGQITTFRNVPALTKTRIAAAAALLRTAQGAFIAAAVDSYIAQLIASGRIPAALARHLTTGGDNA